MAAEQQSKRKPVLVVAPDMTDEQLVHIAKTAKSAGAGGIVVSNTTVERPPNPHATDEAIFASKVV